jgi:hypothetical protein
MLLMDGGILYRPPDVAGVIWADAGCRQKSNSGDKAIHNRGVFFIFPV